MSEIGSSDASVKFDREDFVKRMIPMLESRNMEIGSAQLVEIMVFPELCDLAWMKLLRHRDELTGDLLCEVIKLHLRYRVEAAALLLLKDPTTDQLCCVHTFVPEYVGDVKAMLTKKGYDLP